MRVGKKAGWKVSGKAGRKAEDGVAMKGVKTVALRAAMLGGSPVAWKADPQDHLMDAALGVLMDVRMAGMTAARMDNPLAARKVVEKVASLVESLVAPKVGKSVA